MKILDNLHRVIFGLPILKRCQITANLFLGSQYNKIGLKKLHKLGVTAIVNMRIHSVYKSAQYKGFKYLHLPTVDNTPPPIDDLLKGALFIENEINHGGKAYVHCRQGLGRGPTMALAYLIKIGTTLPDALALIKKVRPFASPRPGQIERLKEFEVYCRKNFG
ncbi:dual specificity protein phosphatase family protein [Mucilaginibacter gracilis]|nr:dual specificity protein phosphatase [Mucilaginibacter gracilis]